MRFIAFAPAQAGLSLFAHLFFPFTPAMNIPFNIPFKPPIPQTRLAGACPERAIFIPVPPKKAISLPYITSHISNHFATKRNLLALAPKGIPSTSINRPKLFCLRRHTPPPLASHFPTHSATPVRSAASLPAPPLLLISLFFSSPSPQKKTYLHTPPRAKNSALFAFFA